MENCIINVACGSWHPRGQDSLKKGLDTHGFTGTFMGWKDTFPQGRTHLEVPYGFKAFAFDDARKVGFKKILWIDAAMVIENPVDRMFDHIDKTGYFLMNNIGYNTGEWCSDAALETLGLNREESFNIPHLMACVMGFDFNKQVCNDFLNQYLAFANDGKSFQGKHTNAKGEVSKDKRVRGHRHDQTVASVLTLRLGLDQWVNPFEWIHYPCWPHPQPKDTIMVSKGGNKA